MITNSATTTILQKREKPRSQDKELQYSFTRVSEWMGGETKQNTQIKLNVDKCTENVQVRIYMYTEIFLRDSGFE